ncbi:hypothetical protein [Streptomyces sp. NPDC006134]|uniref:WXG100 family type VII secretion target n=1 Tax=Streptomyces sp. NPDC006134 TaxID=3154467 RepID=UPI0033F02A92
MDISTDGLKSAAPIFHRESEALRKAAHALSTTLDGLGAPWGGDEQGKEFENAYAPNREKVEKAVAILVEGLAGIGDAMKGMADGHIDNERLIEGMFTQAGRKGDR